MDAPVTLAAVPESVVPVSGACSTLMGCSCEICPAGKLTEEWCGAIEMPGNSRHTSRMLVRVAG